MKPDAVIIGAGLNSLVCAVHLLSKGWSVAIYEAADEPGGAVKTGAYTVDGFTHDWAAMNLSLFMGSAFNGQYGAALAEHGFEPVPVSNCFSTAFKDGSWLGISNDLDTNRERLAAVSQKDAETWDRLTAEFGKQAEVLFTILGSPMSTGKIGGMFFKLLRKLGGQGALDLSRFLLSSPRQWLDETFDSDKVKAMLAAWGMHLDFAPDVAGGALFPYLEGMANQGFGMALGKGGAGGLTKALTGVIEAKGGSIHCGRAVTGIVIAKGRATGIELAGGEIVNASKAVIANVAPSALSRLIGDSGSAAYDRGLESYAHAPGTMMIHVALDGPLEWAAGTALREFAYVHLAPSMDQMARTYAQAKAGLLPDEPVIVIGQPCTVDPGRAPDGKQTLWMQVRMVPGTILGDAAGTIPHSNWSDAGEAMAERVFDILETYAPGARSKVIARRVVTPEELAADNPNLVGGDQVCGSHHLTQHFLFRPVRGHADGTTPVKKLYHTGAAVWPGAGTGAGPGFLLAQRLAGK